MHTLNSKLNRVVSIHEQAAQLYQQNLDELQIPTKLPHPLFKCAIPLQSLQTLIEIFGEVVEWERPDYSRKIEPILTFENKTKGVGDLSGAALAIDELYQRVYITDSGDRRILVVSFEGKFLSQFGQDILECPWGIAVSEACIFVALFQFNKDNHSLETSTRTIGSEEEQLKNPGGLSIDKNGDIFIADTKKNRVTILDASLQFKGHIGIGNWNLLKMLN